jgi:hypothetical protein
MSAIEQFGYEQYMLGQEKLRQKLWVQLSHEDSNSVSNHQRQGSRIKDLENELEIQDKFRKAEQIARDEE